MTNSDLDGIINDMTNNDIECGQSKLLCNNCGFVDYQPFQYISAYTYIGCSNANYQSTLCRCSIQQYIDLKLGAKDRLTNAVCHNCLHMNLYNIP